MLYTFPMKRFSGLQLKTISINTFFQFLVRLIGSFGTLIVTLLIAYYLGYDSVGSFTKVLAFVVSFYLLVDFGFNSVFLKLHFENVEKNLGNLVVLRLILSAILIPIIMVLASLLPHNTIANTGFSDQEKMAIMIFSFTLIATSVYYSMQSLLQQKLAYKMNILPSLLSTSALLLIIYYSVQTSNFYLLFAAYICSGSIYALVGYFFIKRKYSLLLSTHKFISFSKELIRYSWPLGVVLFFNFLYSKTDIFILSLYQPNTDIGVYGISYRFFDVAIAIPTFLANSTYPLLLKAKEEGIYLTLFKRYMKMYGLFAVIITPIIIFSAPFIQIFKKEFFLSVLPLQILMLALPFFFLTSLMQWHFIIRKKMKFLIPLYAGALILNIALNFIFIPLYSYNAAAVITGISEVLVFVVMLWYFMKTSKVTKSEKKKS